MNNTQKVLDKINELKEVKNNIHNSISNAIEKCGYNPKPFENSISSNINVISTYYYDKSLFIEKYVESLKDQFVIYNDNCTDGYNDSELALCGDILTRDVFSRGYNKVKIVEKTSSNFTKTLSVSDTVKGLFSNNEFLTDFKSNSILSIGMNTFRDTTNLSNVELPNLLVIDNRAFCCTLSKPNSNSLTGLYLPNLLSIFDCGLYYNKNLISVAFPKINYLSGSVFGETNFVSVIDFSEREVKTADDVYDGTGFPYCYDKNNTKIKLKQLLYVPTGTSAFWLEKKHWKDKYDGGLLEIVEK